MIQLWFDDKNPPKLRPHYRDVIDKYQFIWAPLDQDSLSIDKTSLGDTIKLMEWIKVRIIVRGEDMNVYINGFHVFKYNLYQTIPSKLTKKFEAENAQGKKIENTISQPIILGDYRSGSVGFRSAPDEEALFRNVEVKPIQQ